jgi:hypothetical protein
LATRVRAVVEPDALRPRIALDIDRQSCELRPRLFGRATHRIVFDEILALRRTWRRLRTKPGNSRSFGRLARPIRPARPRIVDRNTWPFSERNHVPPLRPPRPLGIQGDHDAAPAVGVYGAGPRLRRSMPVLPKAIRRPIIDAGEGTEARSHTGASMA